jgi:hypothetical protein
MFGSFAPPHRTATVVLITLAAALAAAAAAAGIDENPPGAVLAALSGAALVTALAHHWRAPRRFLAFAAVCLGAVVALGAVGIGIDISVTSHYVRGPAASVLESAGSALVLAIAFVGVPAVLVGLVGGLTTWLLGRRK